MLKGMMNSLLLGDTPKVGDTAPGFTATDTDGNAHTLSTLREKGPVILAFFPAAFTPG